MPLIVSILILVDQSLELELSSNVTKSYISFNPYFSGSVTGTDTLGMQQKGILRFNPYFSGSVTGTNVLNDLSPDKFMFQSLF